MFDVTDPANGPEAVNRIIADLGSCVYDNPINPLPTLDTLQLSYLDPLTLTRTDIPKNTACTTATRDTEDGWNQPSSSGPVLICGQSCESLRQVLTDLSVASFATNTQAPKFPITVTLPCDDLTQLLGQQGGN
jgi:hypothetical protein